MTAPTLRPKDPNHGTRRLPPGDRPARHRFRRLRRAGGDALSPRAERLPAHRPRQVDLHQLRHRRGVRRRLPPAVRRHEPGNRGHEIRRIDPARRALARVRLEREALLRLGLLRTTVRAGDPPDPGREGVRGQPERRGDPEGPRHDHGAGRPQPVPGPHGGGEPRPLRPHEGGGVPRRGARPAREDRHGGAEHEAARPAALPHPPRDALPPGRRLVPLPDVRLRPPALRRDRGDHALHLHARVREQPGGLRLARRQPLSGAPSAPVRVRAPQPRLHGDEQAETSPAGGGGPRLRLGRSADADDRRDAPPRLRARGDPALRRAHRRGQGEQPRQHGAARGRDPGRPERPRAAGDGGPAASQGDDHELAGRPRGGTGDPPRGRRISGRRGRARSP